MKAGIYLGKEQVEIQELPLPEVGDNDVLVQNLYSSIAAQMCGFHPRSEHGSQGDCRR